MNAHSPDGEDISDRAEREHDAQHLLQLYLRDHWALAGAGAAQADRLCRSNRDTPWAHQLERIRRELRSDDATLDRVRRSIGSDGGRFQRTAALAGERLGRLKLNGRLTTYSPLSRVLEAELLLAGILAKQRLWTTLHTVLGPEKVGAEFETLIERAGAQLTTMSAFHDWAVATAFEPPLESEQATTDAIGTSDTLGTTATPDDPGLSDTTAAHRVPGFGETPGAERDIGPIGAARPEDL